MCALSLAFEVSTCCGYLSWLLLFMSSPTGTHYIISLLVVFHACQILLHTVILNIRTNPLKETRGAMQRPTYSTSMIFNMMEQLNVVLQKSCREIMIPIHPEGLFSNLTRDMGSIMHIISCNASTLLQCHVLSPLIIHVNMSCLLVCLYLFHSW